jgi:hypothetical protein
VDDNRADLKDMEPLQNYSSIIIIAVVCVVVFCCETVSQ